MSYFPTHYAPSNITAVPPQVQMNIPTSIPYMGVPPQSQMGGAYNTYAVQGNYPMNSGPPPPPMGGAYSGYGAYGQSSYGGYQQYGMQQQNYGMQQQNYGMQQQNYGMQQQNYGMQQHYGQGGYGQPGAVPGFTAPAGPTGLQPPMSLHMQHANQAMQPFGCQVQGLNNWMAQKHPDEVRIIQQREEKIAQMKADTAEEELQKAKQELEDYKQQLAKKTADELEADEQAKEMMKENFVQELMRRQDISGTFEDIDGVIRPLVKYTKDDAVAEWHCREKYELGENESWDPQHDVEFLRNGFRGIGTDEDKVINLCSHRSNGQRNRLLLDYKTAYGRDLIEDIKGELSGNFKHLVLALFETPAMYDAYCCKKAIYGLGTDEAALIEIMMTRTNEQIAAMKECYNQITYENLGAKGKQSLERDIEDDTSGDFKRLLIAATTANRRKVNKEKLKEAVEEVKVNDKFTGMFQVNYDKLCNEKKCQHEAEQLYKAGEDKWGTDEETFTKIFSCDDYFTLRQVYDKYVKISQRDIINSVERETSGNYKKGLSAVAESVKCRPMFFAKRLRDAIKGLGTDDATLIRIIAARSEIDLLQIKKCFLELTGQTLYNYIEADTSGDYKQLLLAIVGKN